MHLSLEKKIAPDFENLYDNLKHVSTIFYQIFIFPPNDSPSKTVKNVVYFI